MSRNMTDVREYLFRSLDRLEKAKGDELEDEILRAKAVADAVGGVVATLKAETTYAKETGMLVVSDLVKAQPKIEAPATPRLVAKSD